MAFLITETSQQVELYESSNKTPYIVGVYASAEVENANGRRYKRDILDREINKFMEEKVKTRTAWGELSHPESSEINLDRAAILIEDLEWKGNDVFGKAKILSTPKGQIVRSLVDEGSIGISSRGLGSVNESGYVNEDFNLLCWDIVADASNPNSRFMNGILEGKTFGMPGETTMSLEEAQTLWMEYNINLIKKLM
ncbi:MAG: hypothetical protein KAS32_27500 [Candidatus Peribacteraceae bacterium]|nr:hypothetical protein [Candidatus Peribacteraceae bacterium]